MNSPDTSTGPIRLLLVDYQQAVRRGPKMRFALDPDLEVVGEAGDADEAVSLARALRPDVALMDVDMPGACGVAAIEALRQVTPQSAVVDLTLRDDAKTKQRVLAVDAATFVTKHQTEETLLAAIRAAAVSRRKPRRHDRPGESREEEHTDDMRVCRDP